MAVKHSGALGQAWPPDPEPLFGHTAEQASSLEPVWAQEKDTFDAPVGKALLTRARPNICSPTAWQAWTPERNKNEAPAGARQALLVPGALVWAEKTGPRGVGSWPGCSPSSHSQPSSRTPPLGGQEYVAG